MNLIYRSTRFSNELLIVASALREVGLDDIADRFRDAIADRQLTDAAVQALREWVRNPVPEALDESIPFGDLPGQPAQETAARMLQRIDRLLK